MLKHPTTTEHYVHRIGLFLGLVALCMPLVVDPPVGLSMTGWRLVGIAMLMAIWWVTAAIDIAATALVPLVAFPLMNICSVRAAATPFGHPMLFLLLGGFLIACALQRWNLHKRIALTIAVYSGERQHHIILGIMLAVAFLSMWLSNTATTLMTITIAQSLIDLIGKEHQIKPEDNRIGTAMMLGIAYAASLGGMATLVGTVPNAYLAAFLADRAYGLDITFVSWMMLALPVVLVMVPYAWFILTYVAFPVCTSPEFNISAQGKQYLRHTLDGMGKIKVAEWRVGIVFLLVALGWLSRPLLQTLPMLAGLNDTSISIFGALFLFVLPSGSANKAEAKRLLLWSDTKRLPWGVLLLLGGGLSLASAISTTDLAHWIGIQLVSLGRIPTEGLVFLLAIATSFVTELTSNTATSATFIPLIAALAKAIGTNPLLLTAPVTMTASCAFMLPVATPPNALVFSTRYVTVQQMVRSGFLINLGAVIWICIVCLWLVPILF